MSAWAYVWLMVLGAVVTVLVLEFWRGAQRGQEPDDPDPGDVSRTWLNRHDGESR